MQNHKSILENIFSNAVEMENKDERASYLKTACGDDRSKLAEVQSMLRDHSAAGAMFDRTAAVAPTIAAE